MLESIFIYTGSYKKKHLRVKIGVMRSTHIDFLSYWVCKTENLNSVFAIVVSTSKIIPFNFDVCEPHGISVGVSFPDIQVLPSSRRGI